jgi:hypothetical protein
VNLLGKFIIKTDKRSELYLTSIWEKLIELFGVSEDEAYGRINRYWGGRDIIGDEQMIYHEDEEYWAKTLYYGKGSLWWLHEGEDIEPTPYP